MKYGTDFRRDWVGILRASLAQMGVKHDPNLTDNELSFVFWNFYARYVQPRPRKVLRAKEFQCPQAVQAGLDALVLKFESGDDVNAHLSEARLDANHEDFHDGLFNNFGIHHFHLGLRGKRSNDCLFAMVMPDAVLCVDVLPHKPAPYGNPEFVQRLHDNWPERIAHRRLNGPQPGLAPVSQPTGKEVIRARKGHGKQGGHVEPIVRARDGSAYALGGGITTAGVSPAVVKMSAKGFREVAAWQKYFNETADDLVATLKVEGHKLGEPPTFQFMTEDGKLFFLYESTAQVKIPLGEMNL